MSLYKQVKKFYILQVFHHLFPFLLSYATRHRISAGSGIFPPSNFFRTEFPPFCILRITYTCKKLLTGAILCFQDYYFISTSSPDDLHNMEGGYCRTHNMKVVFKVGPNSPRWSVDSKMYQFSKSLDSIQWITSSSLSACSNICQNFPYNSTQGQI